MTQTYKISILSALAFLFLLPLFFWSGNTLPLSVSKSAFMFIFGLALFIVFLVETLRQGGLRIISHYIMWAVIALPLVYLISALFSSSPLRSLFGYNFEAGTFAFIVVSTILMLLVAHVFSTVGTSMRAIQALFLSFGVLALFAIVKILSGGDFPTWGTFFGNMGNPVGRWTDYAVIFGVYAVVSLLAIQMLALKGYAKVLSYVSFFLSIILLAIINFAPAWALVFGTSLIFLVYGLTMEKRVVAVNEGGEAVSRKPVIWPAAVLFAISILFVFNPTVSSTGSLGNLIGSKFGVSNTDIRPSLGTTLSISKQAITKNPILGTGPNTFERDWLKYKPAEINSTTFWGVSFPYGFGFLPTQIASTGLLGTLAWLVFLVLFLLAGIRIFVRVPENRTERFVLTSNFITALFLWIATIIYVPSSVILALAFIFSGLFFGAAQGSGYLRSRELNFSRSAIINFASVLLIIVLGIGALTLGFLSIRKTVSAYHFQKAVVLANTANTSVDAVEAEIVKAINLSPEDTYFAAMSQLSFAKAQAAANSSSENAEANRQAFQQAISNSIAAAQSATQVNPESYTNWVTLGSVYASLVPAPLAVEGAYDSAKSAYAEAQKRSPLSPEIPLLLARLEYAKKNTDAARAHIEEALRLKQDYADAYFLLTQLEAEANNIPQAIKSAETSAILSPDNAGVFFQLGLLKYSNNDFLGAGQALSQALRITPEYANAKYFLGLALAKLGRWDEAVAQFEALIKSNPDNTELPTILESLKQKKDPFPAQTNSTKPEDRKTPPITQTER